MKTFALFGFTLIESAKIVCLVRAKDLKDAAASLAGEIGKVRLAENDTWLRMHFEVGAECSEFSAGICTPEMIVRASEKAGFNTEGLVSNVRYTLQRSLHGLIIGEVACLEP